MLDSKDKLINERVSKIRKELKINQVEVESETGIKQAALSKIENGKQEVPNELLVFYYRKYNISSNWLLTGEGDVFVLNNENASGGGIERRYIHKANIYYIPNPAQAGIYRGVFDVQYLNLPKLYIPGFESNDDAFLFHIEGDSMYPFLTNGDMVIAVKINSLEEIKPSYAYVVCTREMLVVKRIEKSTEVNKLLLVSDNPDAQKSYSVHMDDITNVFLVKGVISLNTSQRRLLR